MKDQLIDTILLEIIVLILSYCIPKPDIDYYIDYGPAVCKALGTFFLEIFKVP